jgi:phosphonate transport system permease protein
VCRATRFHTSFAEVVGNVNIGSWDAMRAVGVSWAQSVRFGMLPQVLPNLISYDPGG